MSEPDKGSTFTVRLRFVAAKEDVKPKGISIESDNTFRGSVWIVDDDQFILQLCCSVFDKFGIRHTCFSLPREVLKASPLTT
ncbi:hypothetical protein [Arcticibacter sp. MXS-1]|uniref:hypothetical protein n=1 Tax=Arcticibacter sp. MXS-1 TaxID=3341726 RepID=UPI0035A89F53